MEEKDKGFAMEQNRLLQIEINSNKVSIDRSVFKKSFVEKKNLQSEKLKNSQAVKNKATYKKNQEALLDVILEHKNPKFNIILDPVCNSM